MPQLKNKKHELFAQAIISGIGVGVAYTDYAGYKKNPSNASNFSKKHPEIESRIEELLKIREDEAICKREECAKVLSAMIRNNGKSDMIRQRAIETLSKLQNWQTTHIVTENKVSAMSDTELEKILQEAK